MKVSVHVSGPDDPDTEEYRTLDLKATGVSLFFLEAPDPTYPFLLNSDGIAASGHKVEKGQSAGVDALLNKLPSDAGAYRIFFENWDSFLYLAVSDVIWSWSGDRDH
jgi:hypothetical protein